MVDDQGRIRQQPRGAQCGGIHRGRVDGHELDPGTKLVGAVGEPVDDRRAGAALTLPQQALIPGQIDETGVPRIQPHPLAGCGAALPARLAAAGLIDAEDRCGRRLGQLGFGMGDERAMRRRPRHVVGVGDLGHRAGRIPDGGTDLGAQPSGGA